MLLRLAPWCSLAALAAAPGCSLILNTDDLPRASDAPVDAPTPDALLPPDGMLADANPDDLMIHTVTPDTIDEGAGTDGGRPVTVVVFAPNLIEGATITVGWSDGMPDAAPSEPDQVTIDDVRISGSRQAFAMALRVPEMSALAEGETRALTVTVMQASVARMFDLTVRGHDALTLASDVDTDGVDYDEARLYSSITVTGTVHARGSRPLILTSLGAFTVNGVLDASGVGAGAAGYAGAGGCAGGAGGQGGAGTGGACGVGGGHGGGSGGKSGGGGSFGTLGDAGASGGGAAGDPGGERMLVPIHLTTDLPENRGNGGGGGGSNVLAKGGAGGNGGGVMLLTALGTFRVIGSGRVLANGGPGAPGEVVATTGGAGGGGSGGAIAIRSALPIVAPASWLSAVGAPATGSGGKGGDGRIRIDAPSGAITSTPTATRGPAWAVAAPSIAPASHATLSIEATGGCYGMFPVGPLTPATDTCTGTNVYDRRLPNPVDYDLAYGHNLLCASWSRTELASTTQSLPEAQSCIDVVYLPD